MSIDIQKIENVTSITTVQYEQMNFTRRINCLFIIKGSDLR